MVNIMKIIKFGGTSLQTPTLINNAIEIIKSYQDKVVVIISAIGRKGFPYSTDTLIDLLKGSYLSNKEMDRYLSIGETYASLILSNELNKRHINSYSASYREVGFTCDKSYQKGEIVSYQKDKIKQLINKYQVLVIPGFISKSNEGEVITLGRGTSDYSVVLLGKILEQNEVILFKDVDGIYPTIQYPLTKLKNYQNLSYEESLALCNISYEVINKKAILEAREQNIKLIIKNFILNDKQTIISSISSERKVLGFNLINNQYLIATFLQNEVKKELDIIFKKNHIFIKNYEIYDDYLAFSFNKSQSLLIRQIILSVYFKDMIN
ncbi:MAG: hypothetical protein E7180_05625 [Erysipelotrichaceae bacterium]|nr:hypothetical protein [Erysipelotrichaceae bacterium]